MCGLLGATGKNMDNAGLAVVATYDVARRVGAMMGIGGRRKAVANKMTKHASFDEALRLHQQGRLDEAELAYRQLLCEQPDHAGALHLLGVVHHQRDEYETALDLIGRAIAINPNKAVYHNNYGAAILLLGRYNEALASFRRSLSIRPGYADALANLAMVQASLGQDDDAMANYRKALALEPQHRDARRRLAAVLQGLGRHREALALFGQGTTDGRSFLDLIDLGNVLMDAGRAEQAVEHLRQLTVRRPGDAVAHFMLGTAYESQHRTDNARECFEHAARLQPDNRLWQLRSVACCPSVFHDTRQIAEHVAQMSKALDKWRVVADEGNERHKPSYDDIVKAGVFPSIAFSYQGRNNRQLKEQFATIYKDVFQDAPPGVGSGSRDRRRIGFLVTRRHESNFVRSIRGILNQLDRNRFEPWVFCSTESVRKLRQASLANDVGIVPFNYAIRQATSCIREMACDLMYFWEVGTDSLNYFLPFTHLSRVQCTGWGSTITSGVPAVDYFLSSELIETPGSDQQYSEKLWCSKTLFVCEPRLPAVAAAPASHFGLPDDRRLYVCFQNPLKIHPDMDPLFAQILATDPRGLIVLYGRQPEVVRLLKERFARRIPQAAERIVFLSPKPFDEYCRLLQLADVILDTWPYGAGSTCYDIFSFNLPVVTWPGELIVGRMTQACYRKMAVDDLIVHSAEDYVSKAVQVANDGDYRKYITERISQASNVLFNDIEAVREHERLFEEAISARCDV